jgi:hypothetical protein
MAGRRQLLDMDLAAYGLLSELGGALTPCETPLAVMHWDRAGLQFVDMWPVRRRVVHPAANGALLGTIGNRPAAEGEAMLLQFQEQIAGLSGLSSVHASDRFRYLPPAGLLPIVAPGSPQGFDFRAFFFGQPFRQPSYISEARAEALLRLSFDYPPIDLRRNELIWLYQVVELTRDLTAGVGGAGQQVLIFASGHLPYQADARLDVARVDFANFAGSKPTCG